jgi:hypothetical protein
MLCPRRRASSCDLSDFEEGNDHVSKSDVPKKKGIVLCPVFNADFETTGYHSPVGCNATCDVLCGEDDFFSDKPDLILLVFPLCITSDALFLTVWVATGFCCCSQPPCVVSDVSPVFESQCPCLLTAAQEGARGDDAPKTQEMIRSSNPLSQQAQTLELQQQLEQVQGAEGFSEVQEASKLCAKAGLPNGEVAEFGGGASGGGSSSDDSELHTWLRTAAGLKGKKFEAARAACGRHLLESVEELRELSGVGKVSQVFDHVGVQLAIERALRNQADSSTPVAIAEAVVVISEVVVVSVGEDETVANTLHQYSSAAAV